MAAWRLLGMIDAVRGDPGQSPSGAFSPAEIAVLERLPATPQPARPAGHPLTRRPAVRTTAKFGGFLGRKHDREPGTKTLWRGDRRLQLRGCREQVRSPRSADPPEGRPSRAATASAGTRNLLAQRGRRHPYRALKRCLRDPVPPSDPHTDHLGRFANADESTTAGLPDPARRRTDGDSERSPRAIIFKPESSGSRCRGRYRRLARPRSVSHAAASPLLRTQKGTRSWSAA